MSSIPVRIDSERGCGWRVAGGMYLVSGNAFTGCDRMPLRLDRCPTCDHGVKPARGWTWIDAETLFADQPCKMAAPSVTEPCAACLVCNPPLVRVVPCPACGHNCPHDKEGGYCTKGNAKELCDCNASAVEGFYQSALKHCGLLWVGEKYYPTPAHFGQEAAQQGISRRIHQIPRDFVVGETVVLMAHRKAIGGDKPGIFMAFRPTAIEYVIKGDETEEKLKSLIERGITPVDVKRLERQTNLFEESPA